MATPTPTIYYNPVSSPPVSKTIVFPEMPYAFQVESPNGRIVNRSISKVSETLNTSPDQAVSMKWRWLENIKHQDLRRQLNQWWTWACQGYPWQLALNPANKAWTTLSADAQAGTNLVTVTSTAGLIPGNQYVLRSKTRQEVVRYFLAVGNTLHLSELLNFDYGAGARLRDEFYWPALLYVPNGGHVPPPTCIREKPPLHFDVELAFTEDMTTL